MTQTINHPASLFSQGGLVKPRMRHLAALVLSVWLGCQPSADPAGPTEGDDGRRLRPTSITIVDIGTLGGTNSAAAGISDMGHIAGWSSTPGNAAQHAFLWQNGVMMDLGTLGGPGSYAEAVNSAGQVVGYSYYSGVNAFHPFLWENGIMIDLGTLGGTRALAWDIDSDGNATGQSRTAGDASTHAFRWNGTVMTDLGVVSPFDVSTAFAMNDAGQVVGGVSPSSFTTERGFLWENGVMTALDTFGGYTRATDINETGQIVGWSEWTGNEPRAVLWQNGFLYDLGTLGGTRSYAEGINDAGQIVGWSTLPGDVVYHAFLWDDGAMIDLGTLGGGWSQALDINNEGEIVGWSALEGDVNQHAVLWIPEPPSPQDLLAELMADIDVLVNSGALSDGQAQSLKIKLNVAIQKLDEGMTAAAEGQLQAFLEQVSAWMSTGILSMAEGQPLVDVVEAVLDGLE